MDNSVVPAAPIRPRSDVTHRRTQQPVKRRRRTGSSTDRPAQDGGRSKFVLLAADVRIERRHFRVKTGWFVFHFHWISISVFDSEEEHVWFLTVAMILSLR